MESSAKAKRTCCCASAVVSGPENAGIMLVQVKNAVADAWLTAAGKSLSDAQQQINTSGKPDSFALPETFQLALQIDIETNARASEQCARVSAGQD